MMNLPSREKEAREQAEEAKQQRRQRRSCDAAPTRNLAQIGPPLPASSTAATTTASRPSNSLVAVTTGSSSPVAAVPRAAGSAAPLAWRKSPHSREAHSQISPKEASSPEQGGGGVGGCSSCCRTGTCGEGSAPRPREGCRVTSPHGRAAVTPEVKDPAAAPAVGVGRPQEPRRHEADAGRSVGWRAVGVVDPAEVLLTPRAPVAAGAAAPPPPLVPLQRLTGVEHPSKPPPVQSSGASQAGAPFMLHAGAAGEHCETGPARALELLAAGHAGADRATPCSDRQRGAAEVGVGRPVKRGHATASASSPPPLSDAVFLQEDDAGEEVLTRSSCARIAELTGDSSETDGDVTLEELEATEGSISLAPSPLQLGALRNPSCAHSCRRETWSHCRKRSGSHEEVVIDAALQKSWSPLQEKAADFGRYPLEKAWPVPITEDKVGGSPGCVERSLESSRNKLFRVSIPSMGAMRFTAYSVEGSPGGGAIMHHKRSFRTQSAICNRSEERLCSGPTENSVSRSGIYMRAPPSITNPLDGPLKRKSISLTMMSPALAPVTASSSLTQDGPIDSLFPVLHVPPELRLRPERLMDAARLASPLPQPPPVACGPMSFTVRSEMLPSPQWRGVARPDDDRLAICGHNEGGSPLSGYGCLLRPLWPSPSFGFLQRTETSDLLGGANSTSEEGAHSPLGVLCLGSRFSEWRGGHGYGDLSPCSSPLPGCSSRHHEWRRHELSRSPRSQMNTDALASLSGLVEAAPRGGQDAQSCSGPLSLNTPTRKQTVCPVPIGDCTFQLPTFGGPSR
ncbi:uncharacterized protein Tco025E_01549 [Trypanosoma conorhini]|uniref:Uncharacterized protein n=1 Tax=Trypanosoma conorhini TaxID=83891 RepID=A0A3R7NSE8_9TRYP|nr:uncharacterized protein Tco025E_01549 [Trypanosoma conorhini]RNF26348.1 hypothetical protein Tco025E_01549 [Trypanosoma conorhini]